MTTMDMMQSSSQKAERKTGNVSVVLNGSFWGRGGGGNVLVTFPAIVMFCQLIRMIFNSLLGRKKETNLMKRIIL